MFSAVDNALVQSHEDRFFVVNDPHRTSTHAVLGGELVPYEFHPVIDWEEIRSCHIIRLLRKRRFTLFRPSVGAAKDAEASKDGTLAAVHEVSLVGIGKCRITRERNGATSYY